MKGGCCCGTPAENTFSKRGGDFIENSSCGGVPNIYRARSCFKRFLWILLVLGGFGMTGWQCYEIIMKYYSNETATGITVSYNSTIIFPAVTFCNLNPIRLSAAHLNPELHALFVQNYQLNGDMSTASRNPTTTPATTTTTTTTKAPGGLLGGGGLVGGLLEGVGGLLDGLVDTVDNTLGGVGNILGGNVVDTSWVDKLNSTDYYETKSEFLLNEEAFVNAYSKANKTTKEAMGHQLATTMLSCDYGGFHCSPQNFSFFTDPRYGNCFTFNTGLVVPVATITKTGPSHGLSLELYIEHDEYIKELSASAGIKLLMHNQSYMPFPADNGLDLEPGRRSSVSLSLLQVERTEPPHGTCHKYGRDEGRKVNAYSELQSLPIEYTDQACYKTCLQLNIIKTCGCCYPYQPCSGIALQSGLDMHDDVQFCNISNTDITSCVKGIQRRYNKNDLGCSDICKPSCRELMYNSQISSSLWPTNPAMSDLIDRLKVNDPSLKPKLDNMTADEQRTFIRDNVLKVDIYYQKLNYETISTTPSYMLEDLLSDIGGQLGLFLGLSVVTMMEFVELFVDIFIISIFKCCNPARKVESDKSAWK
ncbi:amiloride-sensitive sodium channel subunit gamma [Patella vulgata]|uniref:amiloride-sensitive sodium channel subunit gamma n=1 Tax=Patella vulgata TaxID=6465 RepID=UPI0024A943C3|nr:amiloride-sensitive sodium channel subunit gamma [Patella vulgata]XP_050392954.2 amiloride-sensitive sodium channel subunit gamma [Patella vulgata]